MTEPSDHQAAAEVCDALARYSTAELRAELARRDAIGKGGAR